ncbi:MAG TPA: nuclear transport factor 2 family protein [Gemmatimonadaceae bacterium]|nr:nuclear transport factor 2 family protein [Gemmatimonadaceae bacterium]
MDSVFGLSSRPDLDRMYSYFSANTTLLHNGKPEDWKEHQAGTRAFYKTLRSVDMHALAHEIDVLSPTAAVWRGQLSYSFADSTGHLASGIAASTWVLARDISGWRIVHLHMSDLPASAK